MLNESTLFPWFAYMYTRCDIGRSISVYDDSRAVYNYYHTIEVETMSKIETTLKKDGDARKCPRCKETKPHEEFYAYLTNPYCKECTREYYRVRNANKRVARELAHV